MDTVDNDARADSRPFHGWKILGLATSCQFVSVGFSAYLIGLYLDPLAEAFNTGRAQIGWGSAVFYTGVAVLGPLLGILMDRGKARQILLSGSILLCAGLGVLSQATSLLMAALAVFFLMAPGVAMLGRLPTTGLVVQWFQRRRGFAVGICTAGLSMGGFLMPPITAALISALDWRWSLLVLSGVVGLVLVPAIWVIAVSRPSDIGQHPDGLRPAVDPALEANPVAPPHQSYASLVMNRPFWTIALTMGLLTFAGVVVSTFIIPLGRERGLDLQMAAWMLSLVSAAGFLAKFIAGWLCDRIRPVNVMTGITVVAAVSWMPMMYMESMVGFLVTAVIWGLSVGSLVPTSVSLIAAQFGQQAYGRVLGATGLVNMVLLVAPGPLGGYLFDLYDSYDTVFRWLWWVLPAAILLSLCMPRTNATS